MSRTTILAAGLLMSWLAAVASAADAGDPAATEAEVTEVELQRGFAEKVQPFLAAHCINCHGSEKPKADLNLSVYKSMADATKAHRYWALMLERVEAEEMPPPEAKTQPTAEEREAVVQWMQSFRKHLAQRSAGDPGPVLARRLSNAEYNYTIRDLTGVDIRPTQEFPVDPANEAGFDNSGESLAMSPALFKKYLGAAKQVAEHLVLKPEGFTFAPHLVVAETDRDKYCILRIVNFYKRQPTDFADYFEAAWRYEHRAALGKPNATLPELAADAKISPKYLALVWTTLAETKEEIGPLPKLQAMWRGLPAPMAADQSTIARQGCEKMRDFVVRLRERLEHKFANLDLKGVAPGAQPFILWKNQQLATHRRTLNRAALLTRGDDDDHDDPVVAFGPPPGDEPIAEVEEPRRNTRRRPPRDPNLLVPADPAERARYEAAFERFCNVFPDAFYVAERGRMHLDRPKEKQDKGRFLTAGFHNSMGYFRDDIPLYELILDEAGQRELDALWQELDFISLAPIRQLKDFIFYERAEPPRTIRGPEFDFARSEDKDIASEAKIKRLAEVYLAKARQSAEENGASPEALPAIDDFFKNLNASIRWVEKTRVAAEESHLKSLVDFAARAYRRPVTAAERDKLLSFYRTLRTDENLEHEESMRDSIVSILMSPHFCYRVDLVEAAAGTGTSAVPLSDHALASRLSYFLWSSLPDEELLARAAAGDLRDPKTLASQTRRMLRDPRARGLAVEFGGNWLDFRRFEEHNAVDRMRFPKFDNSLRQAMFEEPIRFLLDVAQNDCSVLDFLYANHTFVNPQLAEHYGMPTSEQSGSNANTDSWQRIDNANDYGRGGILPMAVFQTKNSPGLRTSPVKRGYWVVRRVLGETIPPPPATVPELPHDEAELGDLTLRQVLARHREEPSCAACHARFDSFGLVFEGFGPVGERREKDLGGRPVDVRADFPGGSEGAGLPGLQTYIRRQRQDDFLDNLCRKLLSYALGRTLIPSDDATIADMRSKLAANDYRFTTLIESIVTSPQFRTKRAPETVAQSGE